MIETIDGLSRIHNVDKKLVLAIARVESNCDRYAIRYEPDFNFFKDAAIHAKKNMITLETEKILQKCSIGMMQVMGCRARELGFEGNLLELTTLVTGIEIGIKNIKFLKKRHMLLDDIIASYNAGSPILKNGRYMNQVYVDKVKLEMSKIQ